MIIVISNESELKQAAQLNRWLNRPHVERLHLSLEWIDPSNRERAAKVMQGLFNDCG
jgi:hypothetical protein